MYNYVDITSYAVLANLPADVVRILPWSGVASGPTGAMPQDFWQKIGAAASTVVNSIVYVGQLIYKGLVALGTFLVNLGEAIAEWGMRALGQVAQAVAGAIQRIGEALANLMEWIKDFVVAAFNAVIDGFKGLLQPVLSGLINIIVGIVSSKPSPQTLLLGIPLIVGAVVSGKTILERLFAAMEAVEAGLTVVMSILSGGVATIVKTVVATVTKQAILDALLGAVLTATVASVIVTAIDTFDGSALDALPGQILKGFLGAITFLGATLSVIKAYKQAHGTGLNKWASSAAWALAGLLVEFLGSAYLQFALESRGLSDPLSQGIGQAILDIAALGIASFGLYELFWEVPGESFLKVVRKVLSSLSDGVERGITLVGFFAVSAAALFHVAKGGYDYFKRG